MANTNKLKRVSKVYRINCYERNGLVTDRKIYIDDNGDFWGTYSESTYNLETGKGTSTEWIGLLDQNNFTLAGI
jgi:hypothetical protein